MFVEALYVCAGLLLLIFGGDALVRGAVALSLRAGISPLLVSLTVVAFGTSAPELIVAIQSALEGKPGIALGNVVGSNIANIWLVLGLPALIAPILSEGSESRRSYLAMIGATLAFIGLSYAGPLGWWQGLVLLALLGLFIFDSIRSGSSPTDDLEEFSAEIPLSRTLAYVVGGIAALPVGAHFLIEGATGIALRAGLSEAVIGLTIVAVGTSLPELATSVVAAFRQRADVAIGNVVGSNVFNLLAIMGIASFFGPLEIDPGFFRLDFWVMLAAAVMLAPFIFRDIPIARVAGSVFILIYAAYMLVLI